MMLETLRDLAAALKKIDIPWKEVRVGDIICDAPNIYRVARIEPHSLGRAFVNEVGSGTVITDNQLDGDIRIIPREFLADQPYE